MGHSRNRGPVVRRASARCRPFRGAPGEVGREQAVPFMKADPPCPPTDPVKAD